MTAEVAILNRSGIAIAADSAVTIGNKRVWQSTNKLFSLGPAHDIAMMIYGSGDVAGCPWEIIIKAFRSAVSGKKFLSVEECRNSFIEYVSSDKWRNQEAEEIANAHLILSRVEYVLQDLEFAGKIDFREKVIGEANRLRTEVESDKSLAPLKVSLKDFEAEFFPMICRFLAELSNNVITKAVGSAVTRYVYEYYRRARCPSGYESGVVFLGFGENQNYPVVDELICDGRFKDRLRYWSHRQVDLNNISRPAGVIISFAQRDMTELFMEGISKQYIAFFMRTLDGLLESKTEYMMKTWVPDDQKVVEQALRSKEDKELLSAVGEAFSKMRKEEVVSPLMETIRALPREETVAMAEAFVELTSMRRKVDSTLQTVGGPVDVAFISKGDGFAWIKRKMYFDPKINNDYFARRVRILKEANS